MYLDTACDRIIVPLSEVLRGRMDDMPHSFFNYYTYSIKDELSKKVILEDDILKSTDHENKISQMV